MNDLSASPKVSIGLPVYNGGLHLRKALDSLLAQSLADFELIISDNSSTDSTEEICRDYAAREPRIRYIRQARNIGPSENFEFVLDQARGDYFFWAAHDDFWFPDFSRELAGLLDRNPHAVVAFCAIDHADEQGEVFKTYPKISLIGRDSESPGPSSFHRFMMRNLMEGKVNIIYGMFRRAALRRAGVMRGWFKLRWGADLLMCAEMLRHGDVVFSPSVLWRKTLATDGWGSAPLREHPSGVLEAVGGAVETYRRYLRFVGGVWQVQGRRAGLEPVPLPRRIGYTAFEFFRMTYGFAYQVGSATVKRLGRLERRAFSSGQSTGR